MAVNTQRSKAAVVKLLDEEATRMRDLAAAAATRRARDTNQAKADAYDHAARLAESIVEL